MQKNVIESLCVVFFMQHVSSSDSNNCECSKTNQDFYKMPSSLLFTLLRRDTKKICALVDVEIFDE